MSKLDFSKLAEKLDIKGVMDSVKSIINPEVAIPKGMEANPLAAKLMLLREATEQLNHALEQQQQEIAKINTLISSIFNDLQELKKATDTDKDTSTTSNDNK